MIIMINDESNDDDDDDSNDGCYVLRRISLMQFLSCVKSYIL